MRSAPKVIATPFHTGLTVVFTTAAIMSEVAAVASVLRGRHTSMPTLTWPMRR
jgi:hypothetical protein